MGLLNLIVKNKGIIIKAATLILPVVVKKLNGDKKNKK